MKGVKQSEESRLLASDPFLAGRTAAERYDARKTRRSGGVFPLPCSRSASPASVRSSSCLGG